MRPICLSTSPPEPSQLSPLWLIVGQARTATNAIMSAIPSVTSSADAPSTRSARRSGHGSRRWRNIRVRPSCALVPALPERDPVAGDDLAGDLALLDPVDERRGLPLRGPARDLVE